MNLKYAIPEKDKIESYKKITQDLFLQELHSHGYQKGFDFSLAKIEVAESKHYTVPHYDAAVIYHEDLLYIPSGVKFERFFEISFVEYEGQLEIKKRNRDDYFYLEPKGSYEEVKAAIDAYQNKGPYPGSRYFHDELNRIDQSLKQYKPVIQKDTLFSLVLDKLPTSGYIYQISENQVMIHLPISESPALFSGVKIIYNLQTGDISDVRILPPPSLA